jgi:hypothetical protein
MEYFVSCHPDSTLHKCSRILYAKLPDFSALSKPRQKQANNALGELNPNPQNPAEQTRHAATQGSLIASHRSPTPPQHWSTHHQQRGHRPHRQASTLSTE